MQCGKCQGNRNVKNGLRKGKQCWICRDCGTQFTGDQSFIDNEKRVALTLAAFGQSTRKIGRLLGYSHVTILNWIREFERKRESRDPLADEKAFLDIGEMCAFLSTRNRKSTNIQSAITSNAEHEISKILESLFSSVTN